MKRFEYTRDEAIKILDKLIEKTENDASDYAVGMRRGYEFALKMLKEEKIV